MSDDPFADADAAAMADPLASDPLGDAAPLDAPQPQAQPAAQQPRTQKPRSNVYTMMLILSFAAIVTACVLLWLRLQPYGNFPWWEIPQEVKAEVGS